MATERYTRCPHCASVFRVLPGQLQQAQGWLRCGLCQQPFDATGRVVLLGAADDAPAAPGAERLDLQSLLHVEDRGASAAGGGGPAVPALGDELLAFERALASFPVPAKVEPPLQHPIWTPEDDEAPLPVRAPRRLALVWAFLLTVLLLGQAIWATRVQWAVHWPLVGQWAQTACDRLGCAWHPWHAPGVLVLEHAHLSRTEAGHRLQWVLHNQASWPAAMPSLELTLLDAREQVLLRRVFSPAQQQGPAVLAPLAHWPGDLQWRLPDGASVTGYRLLVFYP